MRYSMYSLEWQKRGLPHIHILLWLSEKVKLSQIDCAICAGLPYPQDDPILDATVTKQMIQGPCGTLDQQSPP